MLNKVKKYVLATSIATLLPVSTMQNTNAQNQAQSKHFFPFYNSQYTQTVNSYLLRKAVNSHDIMRHLYRFQRFADQGDGSRASGTEGYNKSVSYIYRLMRKVGYDVSIQEFPFVKFETLGESALMQSSPESVSYVENTDFNVISQSEPGDVTAAATSVDLDLGENGDGIGNNSTSGCEAEDFANFPAGNIAIVQRGACAFSQKAENAANAGAVGVIIFNQGDTEDRKGLANVTLGSDYSGGIPVVFSTFDNGVNLAQSNATVRLFTNVLREQIKTFNVIADSRWGDPDDIVVVGAHLDSVEEGPGINDNGSGSAGILDIAIKMAKLRIRTNKKVRFAWWGAEESGLVGSTYYVNNLSDEELSKIAMNLNFDMIGSPNYVRFIYDGDGSDTALEGPEGSAEIEQTFIDYFNNRGIANAPTEFSGRSDYGPFIAVGIPAGGLFTGAEGIKTETEALIFGGTAGEQYDPCYHDECDKFGNFSVNALSEMSDAAAHSIVVLAEAKRYRPFFGRSARKQSLEKYNDLEFLGKKYRK